MSVQEQIRLATQQEEVWIPKLWRYVTSSIADKDRDGNIVSNISWYDTKMLLDVLHRKLLTSAQWSVAEIWSRANNPEMNRNMITGVYEWTDSLIDFEGPKTTLIEGSKVLREGKEYYIQDGIRKEVDWLPRENGHVQDFDFETGLPKKVGFEPSKKYFNCYYFVEPEKQVPVVRSAYGVDHECRYPNEYRRFQMDIYFPLSDTFPFIGFRSSH